MGNVVELPSKASEKKELSYEELQNACAQLSANYQNVLAKFKELHEKHDALLQNNYFVRLEWLWRVITSDKLTVDFRSKCEEEFMLLMNPEEDNKD